MCNAKAKGSEYGTRAIKITENHEHNNRSDESEQVVPIL